MTETNAAMIDAIIHARRSVRAFRPDPVPESTLTNLLETASRAPSSSNLQPWRVYALTGPALKRMVDAVCQAYDHEFGQHTSEYQYLPAEFSEPYLSRRRQLGWGMYSLVGIEKGDKERMRLQQRRNYEFFGAPVGLIFTLDRKLPQALLIDYGAFLQNLMISAQAHGLGTCLQTGWSDYHAVIRRELHLGTDEMVLGGMSLGYADETSPINRLETARVPVSDFATFLR